MYDDDGIGYAGKSNTASEDVEQRPVDMRNDWDNVRRDVRGDDDGDGRDARRTETEAS